MSIFCKIRSSNYLLNVFAIFVQRFCRIQRSTTEWKMFRFVPGRQWMNEVDHPRPVQAQQIMRYRRVFCGCLIMLCPDVLVAKRNFGLAGENIIAGWFFFNANWRFNFHSLLTNWPTFFSIALQIMWTYFLRWLFRVLGSFAGRTSVYTRPFVWFLLQCRNKQTSSE